MPETPTGPREVLDRYHRAMLDIDADALADLYAPDAVHDFPFRFHAFPDRYHGREEVRAGYRKAWASHPVQIAEIRTGAVHETVDPEVLVGEHTVIGTVRATGAPFELAGVLVIWVRDGLLTEVRDYIDVAAVARQLNPASTST